MLYHEKYKSLMKVHDQYLRNEIEFNELHTRMRNSVGDTCNYVKETSTISRGWIVLFIKLGRKPDVRWKYLTTIDWFSNPAVCKELIGTISVRDIGLFWTMCGSFNALVILKETIKIPSSRYEHNLHTRFHLIHIFLCSS